MTPGRPRVAIVGMAVVLPGAPDLDTYWRNLRDGVDAVGPVPPGRHDAAFHADPGPDRPADRTYCHRGGFVDPDVALDVTRMGIMPASVPGMEPDQLAALAVAAAAVADAGGAGTLGDPGRVGVVLGRGGYLSPALARFTQRVRVVPQVLATVRELLPGFDGEDRLRAALLDELGPLAPESTIGLVPNLAASRIANRLDLRGPAYTVDAACASSLVAIDQAISELATGRCDAVLAGGTHHSHDETIWATFTQLGALSPSGRIAPLSRDADGLLIGEGTGVVVLKRLDDAERDGDRVYAVITGSATAGDGRVASLFNPDTNGQVSAVRRAWEQAGVDPAAPGSVGLVEAHGTATRAGDDTELTTLATVFGPAGDGGRAVVGSVKSMIGHLMPAAGIAALVKAALAVHHATLLPTLHCAEPNPLLDATRFRTLATAAPWPAGDGPRRAAVDAFGFGGINAHVVLEEASPARRPASVTEPELALRFAAPDPAALRAQLERPDAELRAAAAPGDGPCRLGLVDPTDRRLAIARAIAGRAVTEGVTAWTGRGDVWFTSEPLLPAGHTAFLFPGLEAEFRPRCADVAARFGLPEPRVPEHAEADLLTHADGVVAVGRLLAAALGRIGITPGALAGHSVGEWTAMAIGGMYGDVDPVALRRRVWADGFTVPDVVFATLGCSADQARELLAGSPDVVVSHDNAPRQCVVCGPADAVDALLPAIRAAGVVARTLPFRSGFHTPMFAPHLGPFARLAAALPMHAPSVPVWSATTGAPFTTDPEQVRAVYLRHLTETVRFRTVVQGLWDGGARLFVVMGPGQLGSFVGDSLGDPRGSRPHVVVAANSALRDGLAQLRRVAVAAWVQGATPDLAALDAPGRAVPRPDATVRLPLDAAPIVLGPDRARALRPGPRIPVPAGAVPGGTVPAGNLSAPVADALAALVAETEHATATVLAAAGGGAPARPVGSPAPVSPPRGPAGPPPAPVEERRTVLEISVPALPYLRGHRLFRQPPGADEADRRPVVPATTVLELASREVERAWPGTTVTGVRDARFDAWLPAAPARHVELTMRREADAVTVAVGGHARITLHTGPAPEPGPRWPVPPGDGPPPTTAADVYAERMMFHGPEYQGLTEITGIGPRHVRGVITVPEAPGGLLDNVGQLLGVWLFAHADEGLLAFPQRIAAVEWFGQAPPAGSRVECLARMGDPVPHAATMHAELTHDGRVLARVTGWRAARLDSDRDVHRTYAFPDTHHLSRPHAGGWVLVTDRWPAAAARAMVAGVHLDAAERAAYDALAPRRAQQWLLGRIAAKDAVRRLLGGAGPARFPAEVRIDNGPTGRPAARLGDTPVAVSIAHSGTVGVALAGPAGSDPGIDVEPVRTPADSTLDAALTPAERALLDALGDRDRWFTRFWTAKEAVGKAVGTGLDGTPRAITVLDAGPGHLRVRDAAGAEHHVHHTDVVADGRAHVVAWTGVTQETGDRP